MSDVAANATRIAGLLEASGASNISSGMPNGELLWTTPDSAWRCLIKRSDAADPGVTFRAVVWRRSPGSKDLCGPKRVTQDEAVSDALALAVEAAT